MLRNTNVYIFLLITLSLTSCNQTKFYNYHGFTAAEEKKLQQAYDLFSKDAAQSFNFYEEVIQNRTIDEYNYIHFWNAGIVAYNLTEEKRDEFYKNKSQFYLKKTIKFINTADENYNLTRENKISIIEDITPLLSALSNMSFYKHSSDSLSKTTNESTNENLVETSLLNNQQSKTEKLIEEADSEWNKRNYKLSCQKYKKAFELSRNSNPYAAYSLAYCYLNIDGQGVKSDLNTAAYYFNSAKSHYMNDEGYRVFLEKVLRLQSHYKELGYYNSLIDGVWGNGTAKAYSQLRKKYKNINTSADAYELAFSDIKRERARKDSFIYNAGNEGSIKPSPTNNANKPLSPTEIYKLRSRSIYILVGLSEGAISQGSAVAVSPNTLFTNCHVVQGKSLIGVLNPRNNKQNVYLAKVLKRDTKNDACILRITEKKLNPVYSMKKYSSLTVGDKVYAIGNPQGFDLTLSDGLLSSKRSSTDRNLIQFTAPISSGSSGGGLFNTNGELIGITTASRKDSQNLNFAIPIDYFN
jgi:hypothetical protein